MQLRAREHVQVPLQAMDDAVFASLAFACEGERQRVQVDEQMKLLARFMSPLPI
jgi:hypothetical protein